MPILKITKPRRLIDEWGAEWSFRLITLDGGTTVWRADLIRPPDEYGLYQLGADRLPMFLTNIPEEQPYLGPRALAGFRKWRQGVLDAAG